MSKTKDEILNPVFISHEDALEKKIKELKNENINLKKIISFQKDLLKKIPTKLGEIMKKVTTKENNELLGVVFKSFCDSMDKHGFIYKRNKLKVKLKHHQQQAKELEEKLNS